MCARVEWRTLQCAAALGLATLALLLISGAVPARSEEGVAGPAGTPIESREQSRATHSRRAAPSAWARTRLALAGASAGAALPPDDKDAAGEGGDDPTDLDPIVTLPPEPEPEREQGAATVETPTPFDAAEPEAAAEPQLPPLNAALKAALEARASHDVHAAQGPLNRKEREAVAAFYAARDFAPLWSTDGAPNPEVKSVIAQLDRAAEDGLDLHGFPPRPAKQGSDADLVAADIALSDAVVAYGRQASGSRIDPRAISPLIGARPEVADASIILALVATAGEAAGATLKGFNPQQKGYVALREKLAELRRGGAPEAARNPRRPTATALKGTGDDPRAGFDQAHLNLDGRKSDGFEAAAYDTQAATGGDSQKPGGRFGSGLLSKRASGPRSGAQPSRLEAEIIANMERWRWMPRDLGESRIEVNIPDFEVVVIEDGRIVQRNRVVVGKEQTPTPIFSNKMQYLIVNPAWNVPQSIIRKEMLPRLASNPGYLRRLGYQVASVGGKLTVRQPPGERNALGRIKFMFPNDYSVYLHDTPSRGLFSEARRAFSHGCVRVDDPFSFAESVLGRANGWSEKRVKSLIGNRERYVNLPKPLPVHIEYFTTYVDESGRLQSRDDIYGYSRKVKAALGLES